MAALTTDDCAYSGLPQKLISAANGVDYAYRDTGEGEVALVLLNHFRGNLDNWDPALVDALAVNRRVIAFDNAGVGGSTGVTPHTIGQMAHDATAFISAMDLGQVDLLGFSIGSFVAQEITLIRPAMVRRLVLASSAPQGAAGMHGWAPEVIGAIGTPEPAPRNTWTSSSPDPHLVGRPAGEPCSACTPEPRTGTRPRPGRHVKLNMTRFARGESLTTPSSSDSAACRCRCSWPMVTATR